MGVVFTISIYHPLEESISNSNFKLDVPEYKKRLVKDWEKVVFYPLGAENQELAWEFVTPQGILSTLYEIFDDRQAIYFGWHYFIQEFTIWHRKLIPIEQRL